MRKATVLLAMLFAAAIAAGCSDKKAPDLPQPRAGGANGQASGPVQESGGVIPQAQLDALKKAENVDALSRENDRRLQATEQ